MREYKKWAHFQSKCLFQAQINVPANDTDGIWGNYFSGSYWGFVVE